jgi:hypothetical protein
MRKTAKFLLVLALLALMPLRAVAAVTIGYCAMAAHHEAVSAAAPQASEASSAHHGDGAGQDPGAQQSSEMPGSESFPSSTCPEHSSFGLFVGPAGSAPAEEFVEARISAAHRTLTAFVPVPLERPPLA